MVGLLLQYWTIPAGSEVCIGTASRQAGIIASHVTIHDLHACPREEFKGTTILVENT